MGCMTDEQLQELHKDIESGLVMIVETKHYKQLEAENKRLHELCEKHDRKYKCTKANINALCEQFSHLVKALKRE